MMLLKWVAFGSCLLISSWLYADDIELSVSTTMGNHGEYKQGDSIQFLLNLNQPAHILMLYQDAQQNVIQILPNQTFQNSLIPAGWFMPIPSLEMGFEFVVEPPFGKETLWVFASDERIEGHKTQLLGNGFYLLPNGLEIIEQLKAKYRYSKYELLTRE